METFSYNLREKIDKRYFILDILEKIKDNKKVVIVCIGTDKHTFDAFGPLVGTLLNESNLENIVVYGNLKEPIHALNVIKKTKKIMEQHKNDLIIAIDAAISYEQENLCLTYQEEPVFPGKGAGKDLGQIGDVSVKFTTKDEMIGFMQNHRLYHVYETAKDLTAIIKELDQKINYEKEYIDEVSSDLL